MKQLISLFLAPLALLLVLAGVAYADQHDRLTPLLGGIEGWEAPPAKGMSLASAQMKMISARRTYTKGDKAINLSLLVNSGPVMDSDLQESSFEDQLNRISVKQVKGFWVKTTHGKNNNSGQVLVHLASNEMANALLLATYSKMDEAEALAEIENLNWGAMKAVVASML